ncbi:hypothetical protein [Streptomyces sp. IBSBF 3136]|uniref:hypothetical protein n=1 Tax=Streptomyces sp. IBSBF 3136 TaxID=2903524 RepID=UPI002FDBBC59
MTRVRDIPLHDSTRGREVRVATEEAGAHAGPDAHRTAVATLVATEPATNRLKDAGGGRLVIDLVDPPGTVNDGLAVRLVALLHSDGLPSRWRRPGDPELLTRAPAVVAPTVLRDAGSAADPVRDDTCVAVLAADHPGGRP